VVLARCAAIKPGNGMNNRNNGTLLFIDREEDLHANWVEAECDRRGVAYLRLCPQKFPQEMLLTLHAHAQDVTGRIQLPDRQV
jgi:hypothetical protein